MQEGATATFAGRDWTNYPPLTQTALTFKSISSAIKKRLEKSEADHPDPLIGTYLRVGSKLGLISMSKGMGKGPIRSGRGEK